MKILLLTLTFLFSCCATTRPSAAANVAPPSTAEPASQPASQPTELGGPAMVTVETFDEGAVSALIAKLKELHEEGHSEIWLRINTNGGSVAGMFTLSQAMEALGQPVTCVADWHAYSAGAFILESPGCSKRLMTKRATLLFHEALTQGEGNVHDLARQTTMTKTITDALVDQTSERLGMTEADFQAKIENTEWVLDYKEALRYNVVDGIISPLKLPPNTDVPKPSLLERLLNGG